MEILGSLEKDQEVSSELSVEIEVGDQHVILESLHPSV